jgi:hypothetical protein
MQMATDNPAGVNRCLALLARSFPTGNRLHCQSLFKWPLGLATGIGVHPPIHFVN